MSAAADSAGHASPCRKCPGGFAWKLEVGPTILPSGRSSRQRHEEIHRERDRPRKAKHDEAIAQTPENALVVIALRPVEAPVEQATGRGGWLLAAGKARERAWGNRPAKPNTPTENEMAESQTQTENVEELKTTKGLDNVSTGQHMMLVS